MNNYPPIIHNKKRAQELQKYLESNPDYKNRFYTPEGLRIIAFNNMNNPLLERNMNYLGIDYEKIDPGTDYYYHTMKTEYVYDYLKNDNSNSDDIILIPDCDDVIFVKNPHYALEVFDSYHCMILFMSTEMVYPYHVMPQNWGWVNKMNSGSGRFLNAGVHMGYKSNILDLYEEALKYIPKDKSKLLGLEEYKNIRRDPNKDIKQKLPDFPIGSHDQDIFRYLEPLFYPYLKVDYKNRLAWRNG